MSNAEDREQRRAALTQLEKFDRRIAGALANLPPVLSTTQPLSIRVLREVLSKQDDDAVVEFRQYTPKSAALLSLPEVDPTKWVGAKQDLALVTHRKLPNDDHTLVTFWLD